jgi:hypothetical protein
MKLHDCKDQSEQKNIREPLPIFLQVEISLIVKQLRTSFRSVI